MPRLDIPIEIEVGHLDDLRGRYLSAESNKKAELLFSAIRFCGNQQIPMPEWVVDAFFKATNSWYSLKACSLDEAFGTNALTEKRASQKARNKLLNVKIFNYIEDARRRGRPINGELFDIAAEEFGSSKTVLEDLYYNRRRK